jgi:hypothetical protein
MFFFELVALDLAIQKITDSYKKELVIEIRNVGNPTNVTVQVGFSHYDHYWTDVITESSQGTVPSGLEWNPEFSPVGEIQRGPFHVEQITQFGIPPMKIYYGWIKYNAWAHEVQHPLYSVPAYQTFLEQGVFSVTRSSNIQKDHAYAWEWRDYVLDEPGGGGAN